MWTEKYRPKILSEVAGNDDLRGKINQWLRTWDSSFKPLLLQGTPGVGKTSLIYALANELNYHVIELNASDKRTKNNLQSSLEPLFQSTTLFNEKILVLIEEVDGLDSRADYGGVDFLIDTIDSISVPIIITCNSSESKKLSKLVKKCQVYKFKKIEPRQISLVLESITKQEKINISLDNIIAISTNANGDLRYAINTLQTYDSTLDQLPSFISKSLSLDQGIRQYLDSDDIPSAMNSLLNTNSNPNDILRAIFSSVVSSSSKIPSNELSKILSILSDVDILLGRILKTREWRQLRYFNSLLVYSLFEHLSPHPIKFSLYHNPFPIQVRIWNDGRNFRTIVQSLNKYSNESSNNLIDLIPYLILILSKNKNRENVLTRLGLEDKEINTINREITNISKSR
jgi:replication factor C large subunit